MAADRPRLNEGERELLASTQAFQDGVAGGAYSLTDRLVEGLRIGGLRFHGAQLSGLDFVGVEFVEAQFERCRLRQIRFTNCDFSSTAFLDCEFFDATFVGCTIVDTELERTSMRRVAFRRCRFESGRWIGLDVEAFEDYDSLFIGADWSDIRIVDVNWQRSRFEAPRFAAVLINGGLISRVNVVEGTVSKLHVRSARVEGLEFLFGSVSELFVEAAEGGGILLSDVSSRDIRLQECRRLANISIAGGACERLAVDRCEAVELLTLGYTEICDMSLLGSRVTGFYLMHSKMAGNNVVQDCVVDGIEFEQSEVDGLSMTRTHIETILRAGGARFTRLGLQDVTYSPMLEIHEEGASYETGHAFPPGL